MMRSLGGRNTRDINIFPWILRYFFLLKVAQEDRFYGDSFNNGQRAREAKKKIYELSSLIKTVAKRLIYGRSR